MLDHLTPDDFRRQIATLEAKLKYRPNSPHARNWADEARWLRGQLERIATMDTMTVYECDITQPFGPGTYYTDRLDYARNNAPPGTKVRKKTVREEGVMRLDFADQSPASAAATQRWCDLQSTPGGPEAVRRAFLDAGIKVVVIRTEMHYPLNCGCPPLPDRPNELLTVILLEGQHG